MSDQKAQLTQSIEAQGLKVRQLKSQAAEKAVIDAEVQTLLGLKKELAVLEGADKKSGDAKPAKKAGKSSFTLKTAKVIKNGELVYLG
jgi:histidyl-tRNA synthetase